MLILVSTPIGNLADISFRAVSALKEANLILCEDTRRSSILLKHYEIQKPLYSYHKFNEKKNLQMILEKLHAGEVITLISDAGTPCLNDPGSILVQACIAEQIPFTAIPGPCSPIMALILSGFDATMFQCIGFLPKKPRESLSSILGYSGTTIAFESPERLIHTLECLSKLDANRKVAVCREMTKTYEECKRGSATEMLAYFKEKGVKGEIVLLIAGGKIPADQLPLDDLIPLLQQLHGLSLKEAIKLAASLLQKPKQEVYKAAHANR